MRFFGGFSLGLAAAAAVVVLARFGGALAQDSEPRAIAGTAFTYQGRLVQGGLPADGSFDFEFGLFASASGGSALGTVARPSLAVTNGLFSVPLDFGDSAYNGDQRFLEVRVRPAGAGGGFTVLGQRQELTPTPYSVFALSAGEVDWANVTNVPPGFADGVDNVGPAGWSLTGNAGTNPATNFIGTTDNQPFSVRVNNDPVLRLSDELMDVEGQVRVRGISTTADGLLQSRGANADMEFALVKEGGTDILARLVLDGATDPETLSGAVEFWVKSSSGSLRRTTVIDTTGNLRPDTNLTGQLDLGASNARWDTVFTANGVNTASDARLKKDIAGLEPGLDEVLRLNPVSYAWKDGDDGTHYGLLAQEVREVLPSVVKGDDQSGLGLNYSELVPVLIKAIQQQQAEIESVRGDAAPVAEGSPRPVWGVALGAGIAGAALALFGSAALRHWSQHQEVRRITTSP